jgi:DNA-binding transcriptional regulator YiaG
MRDKKNSTILYEGLGFPIYLINVPMRKVFGEWIIDINFNHLQLTVLKMLTRKPAPLTGGELRFIIDFLEISTRDFAKIFGVTHTAVLKWTKESSKMNPSTEIYLRLHLLNYLKVTDEEFKAFYLEFTPESLRGLKFEETPLQIDAVKIAC